MRKTARVLYFITGVVFPILIGGIHTAVHFSDLNTPEVQSALSGELIIMGEPQTYWNTWGVVSVMMGISFIVIGLLNLHIFRRLNKIDYPPIFPLLAMVLYLSAVIYVGFTFNAAQQLYGGLFGMVLVLIAIVLSWNKQGVE